MNQIRRLKRGNSKSRKLTSGSPKTCRQRRLRFESLERRLVLSAPACVAPECLEVPLIPEADQFGFQIDMVQAYEDASGTRATFSIFDTGASVVTFSAADQLIFDLLNQKIPVKVPGGAEATGVGGAIIGDVSEPGRILADGLHAWELDPSNLLNSGINFQNAAQADGVQAFIGTERGSPILPTIVGTPLLSPSAKYPDGAAALIDLEAYPLDFGALFPEFPEFKDIIIYLPDLRFTDPNPTIDIPGDGSVTPPVRIPVDLYGEDNHLNPGDQLTTSWSPVQTEVATYDGDNVVLNKTLLFDTGAQLSVISTEMALGLGLDLNNPEIEITVQGAAGQVDIAGFTIDALDLPRDENGDGAADGLLRFTNVPVYVLDIGEGLDGILGMNLLNPAHTFVYDPYDVQGPSVNISFETSRFSPSNGGDTRGALDLLGGLFPTLAATQHDIRIPDSSRASSWHNATNQVDVNNDGSVVPLDALLLINDLNARGSRRLSNPPIRSRPVQTYLDVNDDMMVTPLDALLVINAINRSGAGEGESAARADVVRTTPDPSAPLVRSGFASLADTPSGDSVYLAGAGTTAVVRSVDGATTSTLAVSWWLDALTQPVITSSTSSADELDQPARQAALSDRALGALIHDTLSETLLDLFDEPE